MAAEFYEQGGQDTRQRVELFDVNLSFIVEGPEAQVRQLAEFVTQAFLARDEVTSAMFTVAAR